MAKRILSLFRNLFRKRAIEQALDDELRVIAGSPDAGKDEARAFAIGRPDEKRSSKLAVSSR